MTTIIRLCKKPFTLSAFIEPPSARVMSCPGLLKTTLLGNCIKKIKEKIVKFEKNVKVSSNFRECKSKEIKKLSSYIKTYV